MGSKSTTPGCASQRSTSNEDADAPPSPLPESAADAATTQGARSNGSNPPLSATARLIDTLTAQHAERDARLAALIAQVAQSLPAARSPAAQDGHSGRLSYSDLLAAFRARDKETVAEGPRLRRFFDTLLLEIAHLPVSCHRMLLAARVSGKLLDLVEDAYARLGPQVSVAELAKDILALADSNAPAVYQYSSILSALQSASVLEYILAFRSAVATSSLPATEICALFVAGLGLELRLQFQWETHRSLTDLLLAVRDHCAMFPEHAKLAIGKPAQASVAAPPAADKFDGFDVDAVLRIMRDRDPTRECVLACDERRPHATADCPRLQLANRQLLRALCNDRTDSSSTSSPKLNRSVSNCEKELKTAPAKVIAPPEHIRHVEYAYLHTVSNSNSPYLTANVNSVSTHALVDTGATISAITSSFAAQCGLTPQRRAQPLRVLVVNGQSCDIVEEVRDARISFADGTQFVATLQVLPSDKNPKWTLLLGLPFFKQHGIDILCSTEQCQLPNGSVIPWVTANAPAPQAAVAFSLRLSPSPCPSAPPLSKSVLQSYDLSNCSSRSLQTLVARDSPPRRSVATTLPPVSGEGEALKSKTRDSSAQLSTNSLASIAAMTPHKARVALPKCPPMDLGYSWALQIVGPLAPCESKTCVLMATEAVSRYCRTWTLEAMSASAAVQAVTDLTQSFGKPNEIVTDNSPSFDSVDFQEHLQKTDIAHRMLSPYDSLADNKTRVSSNALSDVIRAVASKHPANWPASTYRAAKAYNRARHSATGESPGDVIFRRVSHARIEAVIARALLGVKTKTVMCHGPTGSEVLRVGTQVLTGHPQKPKAAQHWLGPFPVVGLGTCNAYWVNVGLSHPKRFTRDQLCPMPSQAGLGTYSRSSVRGGDCCVKV